MTIAPFYADQIVTLFAGDALRILTQLPDASVDCCVTSPPYLGLRDYDVPATAWPDCSFRPLADLDIEVTVSAMVCPLGHETSPAAYVAHLVLIFEQVRRVLADDGTLWLNLGDSYATNARGTDAGWDKSRLSNPGRMQKAQAAAMRRTGERHRGQAAGIAAKNLLGIPWRTALALQAAGWILRNDIAWSKPNAMPESVTDRLSSRHEHVFPLAKQRRYYFNLDAIREQPLPDARQLDASYSPGRTHNRGGRADDLGSLRGGAWHAKGRNPGDVWVIPTTPTRFAHFATMPVALADRAVAAGCRPGGVVLDPFSGSGTTGAAAARGGCRFVGIDASVETVRMSLEIGRLAPVTAHGRRGREATS